MKHLLFLLTIISIMASCSKVQEIDNRTESMDSSTKKMSESTEEMKKSTDTLLKLQRQYSTADLRSTQIESLYNQYTDMGEKLTAARKLMLGFEYQLWDPANSFDTIEYRDELMTEAVKEFFYKADGIHSELMETNIWGKTKLEKMSPFILGKKKKGKNKFNNEMIFYALASNIHANNIFQQKALESLDGKVQVLSIFDIIKSSLIKDFENGNLSIAEEVVVTGSFKKVAIDLLKARYNLLITLAVKDLTNQEDMSFGDKTSAFFFEISRGAFGKIRLDSKFEVSNIQTQKDINKKLEGAIKTRRLLQSIGQEVVMDKKLRSTLRNLQIEETDKVSGETTQFLTYIEILNTEY